MNNAERIRSALGFRDAKLDIESISQSILDPLRVDRIDKALHPEGRRARVIAEQAVEWKDLSAAQDAFRKRLKFADGRAWLDFWNLVDPLKSEIKDAVSRSGRERRAIASYRRGDPTRLWSLGPSHPLAGSLSELEALRTRISKEVNRIWDRCLSDRRVVISYGDPRDAGLLYPGDRISSELRLTRRYLFSDELPPSLSDPKAEAPRKSKRAKLHIDRPYFEQMKLLLYDGRVSAVSQAAREAIKILGLPDNEQWETVYERLRKNYRAWLDDGGAS